ncbi:putative coenzyme F420-dependent NADP oxidoreductase [Desulfamplus magnetovallimortis]|uniref:Putative coenzyme F420-dependent NADP oxidoreductase n=1 Tax=Desulfamplus magnetovallimortis TaxID=1246637 RepID=A0A1W1HGP1_9BACT|nr:DUF2520 domain-containing protein [Desulfamplus magnetovallimortis]SLM31630.1 putative coenzyme F420-dependent NADP oxidoreductase [Desulfamplus magnetovallimortis]
MKPKISIIGCGRVGTALAVYLGLAGYKIAGLASRTSESAKKTATASGQGTVFNDPCDAVMAGDIIFITTPDNLIETVCSELADGLCQKRLDGKIFYHCSGAISSAILQKAAAQGAITGSIHPLQSFAPYKHGQPSPFKGVNISLEGDEQAVKSGHKMIEELGAKPFSIPTKAKTLYHAAAVVASNYLVTLEHFALQLLHEVGLEEKKAYEILEPLIHGTLSNIKNRGSSSALTGPVARGDVGIVENHLKKIDDLSHDFSMLYSVLGLSALELAKKQGNLDPKVITSMKTIFNKYTSDNSTKN